MIKRLFTNRDYNKLKKKIKKIKNSKDFKNWEMLKTDVNTLVKRRIQSTMIFKKKHGFLKIRITFQL